MIINGTDLILGRLSAFAAKKALLGESVIIVNSENVVISGNKKVILDKYKIKYQRGHAYKGPFSPRTADRILRRTIRGMLPFHQDRGRQAFRRVMCYKGMPEKYKNQKLETVELANSSRLKTNFITLDLVEKLMKK